MLFRVEVMQVILQLGVQLCQWMKLVCSMGVEEKGMDIQLGQRGYSNCINILKISSYRFSYVFYKNIRKLWIIIYYYIKRKIWFDENFK